jgi:glycine cleavage system T protein
MGAKLKRTPLYEEHLRLGARIVDFAGWQMPIQYTSVIEEHLATRTKAGLFDISHIGEFLIEGKDSLNFLQKIMAKDISRLKQGKCLYSVMCNKEGGTIDDLFIYKFNEEKFMLVMNAGTIEKDFKHLITNKENFEIEIKNISKETAKIDLQGPKSENILQKLTDENLSEIKRFEFKEINIAGTKITISRSGYTGEDGFELYLHSKKAPEIWNNILETGKEFEIKPIGLGARDILRLESCYPLYGHELNENISPLEAGIPFTISFEKDFIGKEALKEQKDNQKRINIAFELEKGIPRADYKILKDNKEIGYVTSGTLSPILKKGIGLALVDIKYTNPGIEIDINIRNRLYKAKIIKKPFYSYKGKG